MKTRVAVTARVRVRLSVLLDEAIDRAVEVACRRAFKHRDEPIARPEDLLPLLDNAIPDEFWIHLAELGVEVE